jgi:sulfonate transport system substrate-binding protein
MTVSRVMAGRGAAALCMVLALSAAGLAACGRSGGAGQAAGDQVVLKVASQRGGTRALMEAAGALDGAPYKIEWSEFPSAQTLLEALGAGAVDIGAVSDAPFDFAYASGAKIKAVQGLRAVDSAATAIVVPVGSSIRSPADLKGKRVATGRGSVGHYFLLLILERAGLKPSDVTMVYLSPGDAKAALAAGSIDAWSTWSPYVPLAVHDHARVIADSRGVLDGVAFQAASDGAIDAKRPALDDFLHRLAKAERWADSHPEPYAQALAKDTGLPLDIARETVASRGRTSAAPIDASIEAAEHVVLDHFTKAGLITTAPDIHAALDTSFNDSVGP